MLKLIFTTLMLLIILSMAHAQKLPNKQEVSLWAPFDIKIDGRAEEWGNKYQAYNKATEVFYTIANDQDNLYLVIHATKSRIIEKIIEGGVSFIMKTEHIGNDMVLFPLLSLNKARSILLTAGKSLNEDINSPSAMLQKVQPDAYEKIAKSIANANKQLTESLKEIKLNGVSTVTDTVPNVNPETPYYRFLPMRDHHYKIIGIDNKYDIKAMAQFDTDGSLTYELKLPIKYLNNVGNDANIDYTITINGRGEDRRPDNIISRSRLDFKMLNEDMETATDFSSQYTFAKKP